MNMPETKEHLYAQIERLTRERDEYANLDCSVQHDFDKAVIRRLQAACAQFRMAATESNRVLRLMPQFSQSEAAIQAWERADRLLSLTDDVIGENALKTSGTETAG